MLRQFGRCHLATRSHSELAEITATPARTHPTERDSHQAPAATTPRCGLWHIGIPNRELRRLMLAWSKSLRWMATRVGSGGAASRQPSTSSGAATDSAGA